MKKFIYILIIVVLVIIFAILGFNDTNSINNITNYENSSNDLKLDTSNFEKAYVKRIIDGDTIVVDINSVEYKVRFIGINTPESTNKVEPYGKEASEYTEKILSGKTVYLEKDIRNTDKYDRLLRYVWLELPDEISSKEIEAKMFNAILLINGYANVFTYPPDVKYASYFTPLENKARQEKVGLWGL